MFIFARRPLFCVSGSAASFVAHEAHILQGDKAFRLQLLIDSGYYASACTHEPVLWLDLEAMSGTAENKKHETDELLSFNLRVACPASLNPLSSVLARKIKDSTASEVIRSTYIRLPHRSVRPSGVVVGACRRRSSSWHGRILKPELRCRRTWTCFIPSQRCVNQQSCRCQYAKRWWLAREAGAVYV